MAGSENYDEMPNLKPLVPFDDTVIAFFDELSMMLIKELQKNQNKFFLRKKLQLTEKV